jgi:hypothetical protein
MTKRWCLHGFTEPTWPRLAIGQHHAHQDAWVEFRCKVTRRRHSTAGVEIERSSSLCRSVRDASSLPCEFGGTTEGAPVCA